MRLLGLCAFALTATSAVAESSWTVSSMLSGLGLGGWWPRHEDPVPMPVTATSGDRWAVLVAGSNGWFNYRHQADVAHAYHLLRKNGYPEERIIVMMYDDIANDARNPEPGKIINQPNGEDVYKGIKIDYSGEDVNPTVFMSVLIGEAPGVGSGKVLKSGPNDHVFINFADHGGVGLIAFPMGKIVTSKQLVDTLTEMHTRKMYGELVFYMEACESGSMFENLLGSDMNIFATTASTASQSSYATYWDLARKTFLGDLYSVAWMEDSDTHFFGAGRGKQETLEAQYQSVYNRTKTNSQPQQYGDIKLANRETLEAFQAYAAPPADDERQFAHQVLTGRLGSVRATRDVYVAAADDVVDARDVTIESLKRALASPTNAGDVNAIEQQLEAEYRALQRAQDRFQYLAYTVAGDKGRNYARTPVAKVMNHDCLSESLLAFVDKCHVMDDHHIRYSRVLAHMCNDRYPAEDIIRAIEASPACKPYEL